MALIKNQAAPFMGEEPGKGISVQDIPGDPSRKRALRMTKPRIFGKNDNETFVPSLNL